MRRWELEDHSASNGRSSSICLSGIQGSEPDCMTRLVPELRSTSHTVAALDGCTNIPLAAGRAQKDENHSRKRRFRPWLASVRRSGSVRTNPVLGITGLARGLSSCGLHRSTFESCLSLCAPPAVGRTHVLPRARAATDRPRGCAHEVRSPLEPTHGPSAQRNEHERPPEVGLHVKFPREASRVAPNVGPRGSTLAAVRHRIAPDVQSAGPDPQPDYVR